MRKLSGRKGRRLAPATIRRVHVVLHAALAQAVKWGWLSANPADAASPPRVVPPQITTPSPVDVARLLAQVAEDDLELYVFIHLAVSAGARRWQLCGLQWRDVDLDRGSLTFSRAVVDGPDGIAVKGTKTNRVYRVALDDSTRTLLEEHRSRMAERAALCGTALRSGGFVFSYAPDGTTPWRPDGVTQRWGRARARAGLEGVRLHDLATSWPRPC